MTAVPIAVDLSIVIVNWNSRDYLDQCLASLFRLPHELACEVIVVDSGSFDGSAQLVAAKYPTVRFVQSEGNIGFGRANNLGAQLARAPLLLLLNPDTEFIEPILSRLVASHARLASPGIVGCQLLNSDRSLQVSCVQPYPNLMNQLLDSRTMQRWLPKSSVWTSAASFEGVREPVQVEGIIGACMLLGTEVFRKVGGFSREYFMYAEDIDLCYKVQQLGLRNYYVPGAQIVHHGGGSTQKAASAFTSVMMREAVNRYLVKFKGRQYGALYRCLITISAFARISALCASLPVAALGHAAHPRASLRKWIAIMKWGLGREPWVKQYDGIEYVSPAPKC
jgi:hypothetical protein